MNQRLAIALLGGMTMPGLGGRALIEKLMEPRYSPCKDCGNPAKGGHCFKCQKKALESVERRLDANLPLPDHEVIVKGDGDDSPAVAFPNV
jgi:hypothetical protein